MLSPLEPSIGQWVYDYYHVPWTSETYYISVHLWVVISAFSLTSELLIVLVYEPLRLSFSGDSFLGCLYLRYLDSPR